MKSKYSVSVSPDVYDTFLRLGAGNVALGVRRAAKIVAAMKPGELETRLARLVAREMRGDARKNAVEKAEGRG
jgi:hypothetical protein